MFNGRGALLLVVDGEEIIGLARNGGTLWLTWDGRKMLRMARTGHLRRNIGWGAGSLPDALDPQQGQRTVLSLLMERPWSHGGRCLEKWVMGQCLRLPHE